MTYRIVNTDNFDRDDPDESFVGPAYATKEIAQAEADKLNSPMGDYSSRYYKVVDENYVLSRGFEP